MWDTEERESEAWNARTDRDLCRNRRMSDDCNNTRLGVDYISEFPGRDRCRQRYNCIKLLEDRVTDKIPPSLSDKPREQATLAPSPLSRGRVSSQSQGSVRFGRQGGRAAGGLAGRMEPDVLLHSAASFLGLCGGTGPYLLRTRCF